MSSFPGQHEDETVELLFRKHPLVMRKPLIYGMLLLLLAILPFDFSEIYKISWLPGALLAIMIGIIFVVLGIWAYSFMSWWYSVYIITNRRIVYIEQKGFFNRRFQEWQLDRIYNVNFHINGMQAVLFGYGDIVAKTVVGEMKIEKVHRPEEIHHALMMAVRAATPDGQSIDNVIIPM